MMRALALPLWIAAMIAGVTLVGFGLAVMHITEIRHRSKGAENV